MNCRVTFEKTLFIYNLPVTVFRGTMSYEYAILF